MFAQATLVTLDFDLGDGQKQRGERLVPARLGGSVACHSGPRPDGLSMRTQRNNNTILSTEVWLRLPMHVGLGSWPHRAGTGAWPSLPSAPSRSVCFYSGTSSRENPFKDERIKREGKSTVERKISCPKEINKIASLFHLVILVCHPLVLRFF